MLYSGIVAVFACYTFCSTKGKCSTAQIAIAQKAVFHPNPKIRCLVLDDFQKKNVSKEIFCF